MDLKQIEKLMIAMGRNGMKRFVIKKEGLELELEKDSGQSNEMPGFYDGRLFSGFSREKPIPSDPINKESAEDSSVSKSAPEADVGLFVNSPLVGTFYSAPSPDSPPFVKPGDTISEDTIVCIVEAMKVMNEVKAGIKGKVVEVLLTNGDPVQFGSKLFRVMKVD
ncbi:acetyl-CoA carboxylase biotin carboxyl carrier protein [Chlamydiifrater phoenicopteri]|uniref:acetyl-CoA carboxylase biotin carboxyl carrier protein n=1 Tax=Chlamydiifrater phoenicopteri TaxID=2681469 RepID=UPI001BCF456F|nr:acetyl-CoA carboxylase biotin carboxyl carrier protein [Chlamydiifrater phoenicopteri]